MGVFAGVERNWAALTDVGRTHVATKGVVQSGLVLNLDAGVSRSYGGSGTTWTDLSGLGNTGTLVNGPTYSSSNGGLLSFDGVNDYASRPSPSPLSGTQLFTFEIWVNFTSISGDFGGANKAASLFEGNVGQPEFFIYSANNSSFTPYAIVYGRAGGSTTGSLNANVSSLISNGNWYQIVLVRSALDAEILYLNGSSIATGNVSNSFSDGQTLFGGGIISGYTAYLNGKIASIKIYNRALSAAEIQRNFNAMRGRFSL